jgi:hypothetical protein
VKLPFRKRSWAKIWKSDYLTGFVVRRAAIGIAVVLGIINLPDFVRYMKIEMM